MNFKNFLITVFVSFLLFSCTEDNDVTVPRNLKEYIDSSSSDDLGEVIACAASANASTSLTYVFYYPEEGATDIRYYEADSLNIDEKDFSKYRRKNLTITDVFGGKLQRFSRSDADENWCLVTYVLDGKLHKSNPIRLKNKTKSTGWTNQVNIEFTEILKPKFTWSDFGITDNKIYFQVISEKEENKFISGTYTYNKLFQYFDTSNIVLNINVPETPEDLVEDTEYVFTMMAVSEDNWVNAVIQEAFIPRNLQEYLDVNSTKIIEVATAFAASSAASQSLSYIYYYPLVGASDFRYYETESVSAAIDENDFSNYRRKNLTDEAVFGGKLRRYSRNNDKESWSVITYVIDDKLYKSNPIKIKNQTKATEWFTDVTIDDSQTLMPKFTWTDGSILENDQYLQVLSLKDDTFISGTYTTEKTFQYYNESNVTSTINTETPASLILNDEYKFMLMGLSNDNWVNLVIQKSFIVE